MGATWRVAAALVILSAVVGCSNAMSAQEWCAAAGAVSGRAEARDERTGGALTNDAIDDWSSQAEATAELAERPPGQIADEVAALAEAARKSARSNTSSLSEERFDELTDAVSEFLTDECGIEGYGGTNLYADVSWNERQNG